MALIAVTGQPGARHEEVARFAAQELQFELITGARLDKLIRDEFENREIPDSAYSQIAVSMIARMAVHRHIVTSAEGSEFLFAGFPGHMRVLVVAPEARRIGTLMVEKQLDRPAAKNLIQELEFNQRNRRKRRFRRASCPPEIFDLVLNTDSLEPEQAAEVLVTAAHARHIPEAGLLPAPAEAHLQFQIRLKLARYGITPPRNLGNVRPQEFVHPSEEIFASLLDFYRVAWEYEPRSFAVRWDRDGNVLESFTPDFYLPQFDLYVELTTMKQSLVTRKNRKVKLLRSLYPEINIQVFYQKDFENLVFKYGLGEPAKV